MWQCLLRTLCKTHRVLITFITIILFVGSTAGLFPISSTQIPGDPAKLTKLRAIINMTFDHGFKHVDKDLKSIEMVDLESIRKKLNEDDLYESTSKKTRKNERSYIYIHGSKYKVPMLQRQGLLPKRYKTFVSNDDSVDFGKFEDLSNFYKGTDLNGFRDTVSEMKNSDNTFYTAKEPYYDASLASDMNKEMSIMTNKVNTANGIIDFQLHEYLKMKDDLINSDLKSPHTTINQNRGRYSKDKKIKLNKSHRAKNKNHSGKKHHTGNKKPEYKMTTPKDKKGVYIARTYPVRTVLDVPFNDIRNDKDDRKLAFNNVQSPGYYREFIELLKPPALRPDAIPESNSMIAHNKINTLKQMPFDHSSLKYDHRKLKKYKMHVPREPENDLQPEIKSILNDEIIDLRENNDNESNDKESTEDVIFSDPRLVNTFEEIKRLNAAFQDSADNKKQSMPIITKKVINVKQNSKTNVDCLYPNCQNRISKNRNSGQRKCNCDSIENNNAKVVVS